MRGHAHARLAVQRFHAGLFKDLHALLEELLLRKGPDFRVFHRQDAVHDLDHGRIRAQSVEEAGEFDADGPRSDDQQLFRHAHRLQRMAIGPDQIAIRLQPRQLPRARAGGQDDGGGGQVFNALVGGDSDAAFGGDGRHAHEDGDLVLLHQMADAARKLFGHPARPGDDGGQVIADPVGLQPEFLGPVHQVEHLGRAQHRLGRNAAPVQADTAQVLALDDGNLLAQLRRPDGGNIAARAGPDHDHVEGLGGHGLSPLKKVVCH